MMINWFEIRLSRVATLEEWSRISLGFKGELTPSAGSNDSRSWKIDNVDLFIDHENMDSHNMAWVKIISTINKGSFQGLRKMLLEKSETVLKANLPSGVLKMDFIMFNDRPPSSGSAELFNLEKGRRRRIEITKDAEYKRTVDAKQELLNKNKNIYKQALYPEKSDYDELTEKANKVMKLIHEMKLPDERMEEIRQNNAARRSANPFDSIRKNNEKQNDVIKAILGMRSEIEKTKKDIRYYNGYDDHLNGPWDYK